MMRRFGKIFTFIVSLLTCLGGLFAIGQASWAVGAEEEDSANSASRTFNASSQTPICYNSSTNKIYANLKKALDDATSSQYVYMYIGVNYDCSEDLVIKKDVHLVLPFVGIHYDASMAGGNVASSPLYKISSSDDRNKYGNILGDANATNVSKYRSICLNMRDEKDITVNGYLHLGGAYSTVGNNGYYSEINLGSGSSILLNSGSTFECYGYVKESSQDFSNPSNNSDSSKICNELDSNRFIDLKTGATLITCASIYDAPTAGALTTLVDASQCPFWEYDFSSLQTYLFVRSGSIFKAHVLMVGPNSLTIDKEMTIIQATTSGESMFYLTSGYLGIEYVTSTPLYSSRSFNARKTNFIIKGTLSIGYLYASEGAFGVSITIDTRSCFLPVNCRMNLFVENGSTFSCDKMLKFLAGSSLRIKEGGLFNINNQVIFHKSHSILKDSTTSIYYGVTEATIIDDAKLLCDGMIQFNTDGKSNGALGAYIEHLSQTGNAVFDTSNLGSDSKLTVTDVEGAGSVQVIITSSGPFEEEVAQFSYGTTYNSSYSDSQYFWIGDSVSTYDITVQIASGLSNGVVQYTIQSSENSDGSNATDTTLVNATAGGTTSIPKNRYLKIILVRGQSAVIKDTSGNTISSLYTDIILVNKNLTITITPNETFSVQMINALADGASSNGRGHVDFEIWESKTQSGTYTKVFDAHGIEFTQRVSKNSYFYMVRKFDNEIYNYYKDANAEITKTPSGGATPSNWNLYSAKTSPKYLADANYVFKTYWTYGSGGSSGCLLPATLITLADGTQKAVENIESGDMLRVFNHETGQFDVAPVVFNDYEPASLVTVVHAVFSNGKDVGIVTEHGFFDLDTMRYEYITESNCNHFIGHRFYGDGGEIVTLTNAFAREEYTAVYSPTTYYHFNYFTEGILSMPGGITGLFNIFEYADNLQYDQEKYQQDIETYGLFTYEELAEYGVTQEMFDAYAGKYLKVALGKGILTEEYLLYLVERYGKYTE